MSQLRANTQRQKNPSADDGDEWVSYQELAREQLPQRDANDPRRKNPAAPTPASEANAQFWTKYKVPKNWRLELKHEQQGFTEKAMAQLWPPKLNLKGRPQRKASARASQLIWSAMRRSCGKAAVRVGKTHQVSIPSESNANKSYTGNDCAQTTDPWDEPTRDQQGKHLFSPHTQEENISFHE